MLVRTKVEGPLDSSEKVAEVLRRWLSTRSKIDRDKEHFWVIGLDTKLNVKYFEVVTIGTLDASLVHPREVFRCAIMQGVASIALATTTHRVTSHRARKIATSRDPWSEPEKFWVFGFLII